MRWGRTWREGRRRRRHTRSRAHRGVARERDGEVGDGGALVLEVEGKKEATRAAAVSRPGVKRRCWKHACVGVCWVGFNPIPVEPNRHLGQAGEVTPLWAGFPPTRGLGLNTCQNTCCQTKPNRGWRRGSLYKGDEEGVLVHGEKEERG
jgi:hypothetical protein